MVYKLKTALTSFVLKITLKRFANRNTAKYAAPYMAVPATMLWNVLISHTVMKQVHSSAGGNSASFSMTVHSGRLSTADILSNTAGKLCLA